MTAIDRDPWEEMHHQLVDILAKLMDSKLTTDELTLLFMGCGVSTSELVKQPVKTYPHTFLRVIKETHHECA